MKQAWDKCCSAGFSYYNKLDRQEFERYARSSNRVYGKLLPQNKEAKILGVGCGTGHFQLIGIDRRTIASFRVYAH